ncbi:hypothetical protein CDL15_Pgr015113 [Punica granatum]|uniref:Uncharacterized protein n=1 Tax=Punica granatum TaxID=22663 RepID=A0A218WVJ7_PUNGR|nr:hypothetical protein CDL15_Pgr015113 [Punica granatum]
MCLALGAYCHLMVVGRPLLWGKPELPRGAVHLEGGNCTSANGRDASSSSLRELGRAWTVTKQHRQQLRELMRCGSLVTRSLRSVSIVMSNKRGATKSSSNTRRLENVHHSSGKLEQLDNAKLDGLNEDSGSVN